jgi:8-oxo-dGTP diphosphatase
VHNGDTWGIPGGARDSHESVLEAAAREAFEEIGLTPAHFSAERIFEIDHGNWRYDTVIAKVTKPFDEHELNEESQQISWIHIDEVVNMNLHPSFAAAWRDLRILLAELGI